MLYEESMARFSTQLETQARVIPEVEQSREVITEAGKEIVEEFGLKPELFDDRGRSLIFTSVASRWAANKEKPEGGEHDTEKEFLADAIALLGHEHSDKLAGPHKEIVESDTSLSDEVLLKAYDKYTDRELTAALSDAVANKGMLDAVKKRMGVTAENEDPYEIRVLSIGDLGQTYGLDAPQPDYSLPYSHPDLKAAQATRHQVEDWKKGLEERSVKFAGELGREAVFAPAWVTQIDGKKMLCISTALADKVLDRSVTEHSTIYDDRTFEGDFAILEHEYTHTQGGVNIDGGITFGINLEELRAEHFSGNKQGYQDIKGFFLDYGIIVGGHPADMFDTVAKGGDAADVFSTFANQVGVNRVLEVALASPANYIDAQSNKYSRSTYKYLGGFDGVMERLVKDTITAGKGAELEERITTRAKKMAEFAGKDGNDWLWNYRRSMGLNTMTDLVNRKAEELGLKKTDEEINA